MKKKQREHSLCIIFFNVFAHRLGRRRRWTDWLAWNLYTDPSV